MPGKYEQMWTSADDDKHRFELCCIPFFPYGQSLGDILEIDTATGTHQLRAKSGHRTIRFVFMNDQSAHANHEVIHRSLTGNLGCQVEFRSGGHYAGVDLPPHVDADAVVALLSPLVTAAVLTWEWADPPAAEGQ